MDFHSLARRELQCLCKKNKIPANLTNLAMADALTSLQHVEGLEELKNPSASDVLKSPARAAASIPGNVSRTSARRKPIREVQVSQPQTQARVTRRTAGKRGVENKDANVPKTPAITSSSKRAPADSACRSLESQMNEDEMEGKSLGQEKSSVPKTPLAMASSRRRAPASASTSVQLAYSTRRSVRLLETTMAELSLNEGEKSKTIEIIDLDELTEDNTEAVPDVVEAEKDSKESDMHTPEETDNTTISDLTEDTIEPSVCLIDNPENDVKGDDTIPGTEFSSEAKNLEEAASVESSQLTPITSYNLGEYSEEIHKDQAVGDSDVKVVDDEEHCEHDDEIEYASEVKDDSGKVACENSSAGFEPSLDMEDSDLESEHATNEEKIGVENSYVEREHTVVLSNDKEGSDAESKYTSEERKDADGDKVENQYSDEEVEVSPEEEASESENANEVKNNMVSDVADLEMEGSDFENINGELFDVNVIEGDVFVKVADGDKVANQNSQEEVEVSPEDEGSESEYASEVKNNMVSDAADLELGGSDSENINSELFDVNVIEAYVAGKDKSPKCTQAPEQKSPIVEGNVLEFSRCVKLSSDHTVTVTEATPLQPLADDVPLAAYQFPRPTQTTPLKSSSAKKMPLLILSDDKVNDIRKANCDDSMKTKVTEIADDLNKLNLNSLSLRELKKRLKEQTKNQNGGEKKSAVMVQQQGGRRMREPLQILSGNQMAVAEQERI